MATPETTEKKSPKRSDITTILRNADRNDMGNAERLVACLGHLLRYDTRREQFLVWDGTRWNPDKKKWPMRLAKQTVRKFQRAVLDEPDPDRKDKLMKFALSSGQQAKLAAMLEVLKSEPDIPVTPDELDTDSWLLNVKNGTVDLRTGELRPHQQGDLITKLAPVVYDPAAVCPKWLAFVDLVTDGRVSLARFFQKAIGYCATGLMGETVFFVLYGPEGENGKTTFTMVVALILGDYATDCDAATFLSASFDVGGSSHTDDIVRLQGARFVFAGEPKAGAQFNSPRLKRWTGGDPMTCRPAYGRTFSYLPSGKLMFYANEIPRPPADDQGFARRPQVLPFQVKISERVQGKIQDYHRVLFAEEGSGILNWIVEGCRLWQQEGLGQVPAVAEATQKYLEPGEVRRWLLECTEPDPEAYLETSVLHASYLAWADARGVEAPAVSAKSFGKRLAAALRHTAFGPETAPNGMKPKRTNESKGWSGRRLKIQDPGAVSTLATGNFV